MPASLCVLLSLGSSSCRRVLLRLSRGGISGGALLSLLSGSSTLLGLLRAGRLLPSGGFGGGSMLRLLGSDGLLAGGGLGGGVLLGLLGGHGPLAGRGFGDGALLPLLGGCGSSAVGGFGGSPLLGLLASGSFSRRTLLGCMIGRGRLSHPGSRSRRRMDRPRSRLHRLMVGLRCRDALRRCWSCRRRVRGQLRPVLRRLRC